MVYVLLGRLPVSCTFSNACVLLLRAWSWATSDPWAPLTRVDGRACRGGRSPLWLPPQPVCVQRACVRVARRIPMHPCPFLLHALVLFPPRRSPSAEAAARGCPATVGRRIPPTRWPRPPARCRTPQQNSRGDR